MIIIEYTIYIFYVQNLYRDCNSKCTVKQTTRIELQTNRQHLDNLVSIEYRHWGSYSVTRICSKSTLTMSSPRFTLKRFLVWLPAFLTHFSSISLSSIAFSVVIDFDTFTRSSTCHHTNHSTKSNSLKNQRLYTWIVLVTLWSAFFCCSC